MRPIDFRKLHRDFVRRSRPADAAEVAAERLRRRIDAADVATLSLVTVGSVGGMGDGSSGNQHGGGLSGSDPGIFGPSANRSFSDSFESGFVDPWWSQWRGAWTESAGVMSTDLTGGAGTPRKLAAYNAVQMVQATVSAVIDSSPGRAMVFACAAWDGSGFSGYVALAGTTNTLLIRVDSGIPTTLETIAQVSNVGDSVGIIVPTNRATPIFATFNGSAIGTGAVDATHASGYVGLGCYTSGGVGFRSFSAESADA